MISGIPYGIPRLPLSLTSDTDMSLSQKPSVNSPTLQDPALVSVNLMMPLYDLRWTEGMLLFEPRSFLLQYDQPGSLPRPQWHCTGVDHVSLEDGHARWPGRKHSCVGMNTHKHMQQLKWQEQHVEVNWTAGQMWKRCEHFGRRKKSCSMSSATADPSIKDAHFHFI